VVPSVGWSFFVAVLLLFEHLFCLCSHIVRQSGDMWDCRFRKFHKRWGWVFNCVCLVFVRLCF